MPKAHRWITDILKVENRKVIDEVIGKRYNFRIYTNGEDTQRLDMGYSTFEEEFKTAVSEHNIEPKDISNSPPSDYKSSKLFERERELRDDDLE